MKKGLRAQVCDLSGQTLTHCGRITDLNKVNKIQDDKIKEKVKSQLVN
jgi:hypothetical protein